MTMCKFDVWQTCTDGMTRIGVTYEQYLDSSLLRYVARNYADTRCQ